GAPGGAGARLRDRGAHHRERAAAGRRRGPRAAMIQPTRRLVLGLAVGFPLALLPALVAPPLWTTWAAGLCALLAAVAADAALAVRPRRMRLLAEVPDTLFIGERDAVRRAPAGAGSAA